MQSTSISSPLIGPTQFNIVGNNLVSFTNLIGPKNHEDVTVGLYMGNCDTDVPKDDLLNLDVVQDPFSYTIEIDETKINEDESNLITCIDGIGVDCFVGEIEFCTVITVTDDSDVIHYRYTGFNWGFATAQSTYVTTDIDVLDNGYLSDGLTICQCENFICIDSKPVLWNDAEAFSKKSSNDLNEVTGNITSQVRLSACIQAPFLRNDAESMLEITNFNIKVSAGSVEEANYLEYDPVTFGTEEWESNSFTSIQVEEETNIIMFSTIMVAQFYVQRYNAVNVTGNAFFANPFDNEDPFLGGFGMTVDLFVNEGPPEPIIPKAPTELRVCQCEDFECLSFPKIIDLDEEMFLCVNAFTPEEPKPRITNLSVRMFAGTIGDADFVDVIPVWFGDTNYMTDSFTDIQGINNDNTLMVRTTVDERFYSLGHKFIEITGNVFVEEIDWSDNFEFTLGIGYEDRNCLQLLFDIFRDAISF